jgi:hypothetical protein
MREKVQDGEGKLSILEAARAWWDREGIRHRSHRGGISAKWRTDHGPVRTVIDAVEDDSLVHVYVCPAVTVPEASRGRVADLLNRINWVTAVWCFELDPAEGTLRLRGSNFVQDAAAAEVVFEPLVKGGLDLMVRYLPTIYAVAFGTMAPADALAAAQAVEKARAAAALN